MATALEALPNIGSVSVTRYGPDGQLGYSWYVTFVENPGSFPAGSGDVALMSPDFSELEGDGAWCTVDEVSAGTSELSGAFVLAFTGSEESGGVTRYTDKLPYNSLAEEVSKCTICFVPYDDVAAALQKEPANLAHYECCRDVLLCQASVVLSLNHAQSLRNAPLTTSTITIESRCD